MIQEHEKILFRFHSDIFNQEMVETMWACLVDKDKGIYKLDNIPFYAPLIASDDLIIAEFDDMEQMLTYKEIKEYSGNSVIQIIIMDAKTEVNKIRDSFLNKGCQSEKVNEKYFSMEIPYVLNYKQIKEELDKLETQEIIGYAEPCLSDKHKKDLI